MLGCPIVGDDLYGSTIGNKLLLCATEIQLHHPVDKDKIIRAKVELPNSFTSYMKREETRYAKYEHWILERGGVQVLLDMCNVLRSMNEK